MTTIAEELQTWLSDITQTFGHNGETGVDIGQRAVPYHTPVYALTSGAVLGETSQYGGGGVVSIESNIDYGGINGPASLYYQHLSDVVVQAGQYITAGQLIGYSGGQLSGGDNPSSSQYSNGPHIEFGINAPYGTATSGAWRPLGPNVNPLGFLQALARGDTSVLGAGSGPGAGGTVSGTTGMTGTPLGLSVNPSDWVNAIKAGFTDATQRMGLAVFGGLLLLVGVVVLFFSAERQESQAGEEGQEGQAASQVAEVAAA